MTGAIPALLLDELVANCAIDEPGEIVDADLIVQLEISDVPLGVAHVVLEFERGRMVRFAALDERPEPVERSVHIRLAYRRYVEWRSGRISTLEMIGEQAELTMVGPWEQLLLLHGLFQLPPFSDVRASLRDR